VGTQRGEGCWPGTSTLTARLPNRTCLIWPTVPAAGQTQTGDLLALYDRRSSAPAPLPSRRQAADLDAITAATRSNPRLNRAFLRTSLRYCAPESCGPDRSADPRPADRPCRLLGPRRPGKPLPKLAPQARGNDENRGAVAPSLPRLLRRLVFDAEVISHALRSFMPPRVRYERRLCGAIGRDWQVASVVSWMPRLAGSAAVPGSGPGCRPGDGAPRVRSRRRWPRRLRTLPGRVSSTSASV